MDLALNDRQESIGHKPQTTNQLEQTRVYGFVGR